ncbi:MAG TPA: Na+/H+ antiporter NhaC family protein, partial [Lachnospira sp.]|nr:Na+/H+ antiporter NhaC family protein [Lachnospira sp.]
AFSGAVSAAGGVEHTVNLGLKLLPASWSAAGLFIIGCFLSISMGTSVGTISALAPIAVGISEKTSISLAMCIGAVISGAMFGDNLSMISDTTIAATRTQGCSMKDKFRTNFFIVLPAAILTFVLLLILPSHSEVVSVYAKDANLLLIAPYLFVLVSALCGMNVFAVLILGTVFSLAAGIFTGNLSGMEIFTCMGDGITAMYDITVISIIVSCIGSLIKYNGGIDWLLTAIRQRIRSPKGARFGISVLTAGIDTATANNTISIILAGPIAKEISTEYDISPCETASLLDISASVTQGLLPYGAQVLYASAATASAVMPLSGVDIIAYNYYPMFMAFCLLGWIFLRRTHNK